MKKLALLVKLKMMTPPLKLKFELRSRNGDMLGFYFRGNRVLDRQIKETNNESMWGCMKVDQGQGGCIGNGQKGEWGTD